MKITFLPKTNLGKLSTGLIVSFFVFLGVFFVFIKLEERGGETYFSNLKLTIPFTVAWASAVGSFFVGIVGIIKRERSVLVFLSSLLGFLILLWIIAEIIFPH